MVKGRGWLILFIFCGLFLAFAGLMLFALKAAFEDKPVVEHDSVLKLNLAGFITEQYPRDAFSRGLEGANLQMEDIRKALTYASQDERIKGIWLTVNFPGLGWAKAQEIRSRIEQFKKSGKFVVSHLRFCNEKSYYLASVADEIYMQPQSYAEFNGLAVQVPFVKGLLTKLGVNPQVENIGKYKSAGDIFKRESMSPAHREQTESLLSEFYTEFVDSICARRDIDKPDLTNLLDGGIYSSEEALAADLFDALCFEPELEQILLRKVHRLDSTELEDKKLNVVAARHYARISPDEVGLAGGDKVALIYASGDIVSGSDGFDPVWGRHLGARSFERILQSAQDDDEVKAVVLRVDSPGGDGLASDQMWAAIEEVRKQKPVVVSMSDVAASGGYWISMNCDAIVAQPLTITGSIGVVTALYDLSGTYEKLGINWETVKTGPHADMPTDKRTMTKTERAQLNRLTESFYRYFVEKVAAGRTKSWDEVHEIAQGRVWTGTQAMQHGLVDSLGGLDVAVAIAREKAGLDASGKTDWLVYPRPKGFLQSLFDQIGVRAARLAGIPAGKTNLLQQLPSDVLGPLRQVARASRLRPGEISAILPFVPEVE